MKQKNKDYISDEVIKSPHRKRENLSARKKDRFELTWSPAH